jgi:hypothetical protein
MEKKDIIIEGDWAANSVKRVHIGTLSRKNEGGLRRLFVDELRWKKNL